MSRIPKNVVVIFVAGLAIILLVVLSSSQSRDQQSSLAFSSLQQQPGYAMGSTAENHHSLSKQAMTAMLVALQLPVQPPQFSVKDTSATLESIIASKKVGPGLSFDQEFRLKEDDVKFLTSIAATRLLKKNFSCFLPGCAAVWRNLFWAYLSGLKEGYLSAKGVASRGGVTNPQHVDVTWTTLYPTISCSSTVRLCQEPDECRFVCNPEHLLQAQSGPLTILSVGSNNQWLFEESILKRFGASNIGKLLVFDCTVDAETPPREVKSHKGFAFFRECLSGPGVEPPKSGAKTLTMKDLKGRIGSNRIHILKIDIEESEYSVIHDWLRLSLQEEEQDQSLVPKVDMLQMEIHLPLQVAGFASFAHLLVLELQALGFLLARQERNPYYGHCMEMLFVHVDYYMQSEAQRLLGPLNDFSTK